MHDDDESFDLIWSPEAAAEIRDKIARKLAQLAKGDAEEFRTAMVSAVTTLTAAAADAAALAQWRYHRDHGTADGDGSDEVNQAADTIAAVLAWAAWAAADGIVDLTDPELN